jgi:hypothetical protein
MPCASAPAAVSLTRASKKRVESRLPNMCARLAKCVIHCELSAACSLVVVATSRLVASFVPARSTVRRRLHIHGDVPAFALRHLAVAVPSVILSTYICHPFCDIRHPFYYICHPFYYIRHLFYYITFVIFLNLSFTSP